VSGWGGSFGSSPYVVMSRPPARGFVIHAKEIVALSIAAGVLTVDIAFLTLRECLPDSGYSCSFGWYPVAQLFAFAATVVVTAFVCHEMAHKAVAQRFGHWAEFQLSPMGLLISFVTAFLGFLFALPGATVVQEMGDEREFGQTALAGPGSNLAFSTAFFAAAGIVTQLHNAAWIAVLFEYLAFYNGYFAAFNLIPIGPLDGRKVWRWDRRVWILAFAFAAGYALFGYFFIANQALVV
jgi:Zn-dependent protease